MRTNSNPIPSSSRTTCPGIAWKLDWPPGDYASTVPWIRQRTTRSGIAEHFRLLAEHHVAEQSSAEVTSVLVDGPDAIVIGELHNVARPTGRSYDAAFALHLTVEDGLITRHHVYEDSLTVMQAFEDCRPPRHVTVPHGGGG